MSIRNKILWIVAALVIVLASSGIYWRSRQKQGLEVSYRQEKVVRGDLEISILATGTVQPENRLEIKPPVAGRVEQVLVKEGQKVKKGQILAWMSSTERAAMLDAARAKGEDEVKKWEELYRPTPILAPIPGTIILRNVESGQTFTNADSVFVMSDRLTVKAQVDETDIAQVKLGQKARLVLDAYPGKSISAHADQIAFDAKTVNNVTTYIVDVLPEETPEYMRSGMTASVTFFVASRNGTLLVPTEAIKVREKQRFVLVPGLEGRPPVEKLIETGLSDGKRTEILSGLSEGDPLMIAEMKATGAKTSGTSNPFAPMPPRRSGGGR